MQNGSMEKKIPVLGFMTWVGVFDVDRISCGSASTLSPVT